MLFSLGIIVFASILGGDVLAQWDGEWRDKNNPWRASGAYDLVIASTGGNTYQWLMRNDGPNSTQPSTGFIYRRVSNTENWTVWQDRICTAIEGCQAYGNIFMLSEDHPTGYSNAVYVTKYANLNNPSWDERDSGLPRNRNIICMTLDTTTIDHADDDTFTCYIGFFEVPTPSYSIYKTTDGGRSWNGSLQMPDQVLQKVTDIYIYPRNPEILVASSWGDWSDGVWRSTNSGSSWTQILDDHIQTVATSSNNDSVIYAANGYQADNWICRTTDAGQNWRRLYYADMFNVLEIEVLSRNPDKGQADTLIAVLENYDPLAACRVTSFE